MQCIHLHVLCTYYLNACINVCIGIQREHSEDISTTSFTACLSSDSRVLNSDLASQWLSQFKTNVEMFRML